MRCGSVAVSASASSAARSLSALSTMSSTDMSLAGASCATAPIRALGCTIDAAVVRQHVMPWISWNSVVLPEPFLPTKPVFDPVGKTTLALSKSVRLSIL